MQHLRISSFYTDASVIIILVNCLSNKYTCHFYVISAHTSFADTQFFIISSKCYAYKFRLVGLWYFLLFFVFIVIDWLQFYGHQRQDAPTEITQRVFTEFRLKVINTLKFHVSYIYIYIYKVRFRYKLNKGSSLSIIS